MVEDRDSVDTNRLKCTTPSSDEIETNVSNLSLQELELLLENTQEGSEEWFQIGTAMQQKHHSNNNNTPAADVQSNTHHCRLSKKKKHE